jgi:hypothetical protein
VATFWWSRCGGDFLVVAVRRRHRSVAEVVIAVRQGQVR